MPPFFNPLIYFRQAIVPYMILSTIFTRVKKRKP